MWKEFKAEQLIELICWFSFENIKVSTNDKREAQKNYPS